VSHKIQKNNKKKKNKNQYEDNFEVKKLKNYKRLKQELKVNQ